MLQEFAESDCERERNIFLSNLTICLGAVSKLLNELVPSLRSSKIDVHGQRRGVSDKASRATTPKFGVLNLRLFSYIDSIDLISLRIIARFRLEGWTTVLLRDG